MHWVSLCLDRFKSIVPHERVNGSPITEGVANGVRLKIRPKFGLFPNRPKVEMLSLLQGSLEGFGSFSLRNSMELSTICLR